MKTWWYQAHCGAQVLCQAFCGVQINKLRKMPWVIVKPQCFSCGGLPRRQCCNFVWSAPAWADLGQWKFLQLNGLLCWSLSFSRYGFMRKAGKFWEKNSPSAKQNPWGRGVTKTQVLCPSSAKFHRPWEEPGNMHLWPVL